MRNKYFAIGISMLLFAVIALPVFAQSVGTSTTGTSTDQGTTTPPVTVADPVISNCMQIAVDRRDSAIPMAFHAYHNNVGNALASRRTALISAWGLTDRAQRRLAVRQAWDAFHGTWRRENRAWNTARRAAWLRFDSDKLLCSLNQDEVGLERRRGAL